MYVSVPEYKIGISIGGLDDLWIYFENLYDLYHQDALDKSLLSVFCM